MRIGLTCSTIEPALTSGKIDGIGVYTKTLLDQLAKLQHEVTPFSFPTLTKWLKSSGFSQGKIFPLPYTPATLLSLIQPCAELLYKNSDEKIDLLHVTDHMIPRISHAPIIATIHDALMFTHPEWYQSKLRGIKNTLRKKTFHWVKHFITVSHAMVPELVEYLGIPEKKISVVHNGIAPWWYQEISTEYRKSILKNLNLPEKFILFTGTLQPKKNVSRIIEAYLLLPTDLRREYPLVIAGKAGWDAKDILIAIQKLQTEKAGYWLDYVSNEELRVLYQSATVYLCPSLHEGFGYTLLEAFAAKTPVISANISALPEIAGDAAYLVDPYSVAEIRTAMRTLLTDESLRSTLVQKGYARAKEFSLEKCVSETLKVYQRI